MVGVGRELNIYCRSAKKENKFCLLLNIFYLCVWFNSSLLNACERFNEEL